MATGKTFGKTLRSLRKARGWTQEELLRRLAAQGQKLSKRHLNRFEADQASPRLEIVRALALLFNCKIEFLAR